MANMSYIRFENTYRDLVDCYHVLDEAGSVRAIMQNLSEGEKEHLKKLLALCKNIHDHFGNDKLLEPLYSGVPLK